MGVIKSLIIVFCIISIVTLLGIWARNHRCPENTELTCLTYGYQQVVHTCLLIGQYNKCRFKGQEVIVAEPIQHCSCTPL